MKIGGKHLPFVVLAVVRSSRRSCHALDLRLDVYPADGSTPIHPLSETEWDWACVYLNKDDEEARYATRFENGALFCDDVYEGNVTAKVAHRPNVYGSGSLEATIEDASSVDVLNLAVRTGGSSSDSGEREPPDDGRGTDGEVVSMSSSPAMDIPPGPGVTGMTSDTITVPDMGCIVDVNVEVDITHTWLSDLTLTIAHESGLVCMLAERVGSNGDDFQVTMFDDDAAMGIADGSPPFDGAFRPQDALFDYRGLRDGAVGDWTLNVMDGVAGDTGRLNGWRLILTVEDPEDVAFPDVCPVVRNRIDGDFVCVDAFELLPGPSTCNGTETIVDVNVDKFSLSAEGDSRASAPSTSKSKSYAEDFHIPWRPPAEYPISRTCVTKADYPSCLHDYVLFDDESDRVCFRVRHGHRLRGKELTYRVKYTTTDDGGTDTRMHRTIVFPYLVSGSSSRKSSHNSKRDLFVDHDDCVEYFPFEYACEECVCTCASGVSSSPFGSSKRSKSYSGWRD